MIKPIRIVLVDDQALFREALRTLLTVQPDFDVVGEAGNGEEALRVTAQVKPDIVLMDLRMPVLDGVLTTRKLHETQPEARVIVLTTFDDDELVFDGLRAGAAGYLLKDASSDKLYEAIRAAARGEYFLMPSITAKVMAEFARLANQTHRSPEPSLVSLSDRELQILRLISTGASNREVAESLIIAEGTVKNHITSILGKLGVNDRLQAVLKAKEIGVL